MALVANTKLLSVKIDGHSAWDGVYYRYEYESWFAVYKNYSDASKTLTNDPSYLSHSRWVFIGSGITLVESDFDDAETVPVSGTILWEDPDENSVTVSISVISGVEISTPDELQAIGYDADTRAGDYIQTQNINMNVAPYRSADGYGGFTPIGTSANPFTGTYNGKNFEIQNLFIDRASTSDVALFGYFSGNSADFCNIKLIDADITGGDSTGSIIGVCANTESHVMNCLATGSVTGSSGVGGFAARTLNSAVEFNKCVSLCTVTGSSHLVAGFIGNLGGSHAIDCYASGNVNNTGTASIGTGGFTGQAAGGYAKRCYATGNVSGYQRTGGFVGRYNGNCLFEDCYAMGNVSNNNVNEVGGFAGGNHTFSAGTTAFTRCYSKGLVTSTGTAGGFVGKIDNTGNALSTFTNCYWDKQTSGRANSAGEGAGELTGLDTLEMKDKDNYTGWNFNTLWNIGTDNNGYPYLDRRYSGIPSRFGIVGVIR